MLHYSTCRECTIRSGTVAAGYRNGGLRWLCPHSADKSDVTEQSDPPERCPHKLEHAIYAGRGV